MRGRQRSTRALAEMNRPPPMQGKTEAAVVISGRATHPILKGLIWICMIAPTLGCILMSIGAWHVQGDKLDGGLTATVIITGIIGTVLIFLIDKVDS